MELTRAVEDGSRELNERDNVPRNSHQAPPTGPCFENRVYRLSGVIDVDGYIAVGW